ncbi:MAG: hypothetical protein IJF65_08335 [Clostridia bacterium]|nr:hypothetical protein [Clostridia bacterium]
MIQLKRADNQQVLKKRDAEQRLAFSPAPNPYEPLVQLAKQLPANTPAHQLAQKPIFNNRDGSNLYNALSRQLDAQGMATIDGYYAGLEGDKLKSRGVKNPSNALTAGLAQAWMGRRPEGEMWNAVLNYPDSGAVLEDLLALRPGLGNMAPGDLNRMINDQYRLTLDETLSPEDRARAMNRLGIYEKEALVNRGMTQAELEAVKAGKRAAGTESLKKMTSVESDADLRKQLGERAQDESIEQKLEEMESALSDYDREQGIKVIEVDGNVYYDYTEPINRMIEATVGDLQDRWVGNIPLDGTLPASLKNLLWFKDQMNHDGPWDLKENDPWKNMFDELRMPLYTGKEDSDEKFIFRGQEISREDLGNILYGYMGRAMGLPPEILYGMGGAVKKLPADASTMDYIMGLSAALKAGEKGTYNDDANDYEKIRLGIALFEQDRER